MTQVLALTLALPVLGAVAVVVLGSRPDDRPDLAEHVASWIGGLAGLGWVVVAAAGTPPTLGAIEPAPATAAAAAGIAVLVATGPGRTVLARSLHLTAVTAFGVAAASADGPTDRTVAVAAGALVLLTTVAAAADGHGRVAALLGTIGGGLVAAGVLVDDPEAGALVALAGVSIVLAVVARSSVASIALPGLVLVVIDLAVEVPVDDPHVVGVGAAALPLAALAGLARGDGADRAARSPTAPDPAPPEPPGPPSLAVALVGAAVAVAAQDLTGARGAGLLLAGAGVLVLAARHPIALVAAVPGLTAAITAFGPASEPEHAIAVGVVVLVALAAATATSPFERTAPTSGTASRPTRSLLSAESSHTPAQTCVAVAAVTFGVVPTWGWAAVALPDHGDAVAAGVATAGPVALIALGLGLRATGALPRVSARPAGRLAARRTPAADHPHGSTIPQEAIERPVPVEDVPQVRAEEIDPETVGVPDGEQGEDTGPAQHPVAPTTRPVPRRAGADGGRGRRRLRGRPGRAP